MKNIEVKLDQEFITLVQLLKATGTISSGGEIKFLLQEELVLYNDTIAFQKKKKCYIGDIITIDDHTKITIN